MNQEKHRSQSGKSLIELMVVLVVVGALVTISIINFTGTGVQYKRQNIARALKVYLERARFDSVKRRAVAPATSGAADNRAKVTLTSATSFTYSIDTNQNGIIDTSETTTIDFSGQTDGQILGIGLNYPVSIKFDQRGQATATNNAGTEITPTFTICSGCGGALSKANSQNSSVIYISPTGTVAMFAGGGSMPSFAAPNVSNINGNSNINPCVYVGNGNTNSQKCS